MDEQFVHEDQMRNARTQGVGSMVSEQNRQNALELMQKMHKIDTQNAAAKARIENNLDKALQCVDNVRDFVGSPEHILGNPKTKHGEIAENVDVWFHNADQIMRNRKADATFEGVGRTVATDYKVHGVDVQSKYINGANNSLSHVLKHMEDYIGNYEAFGKDGYYVIPKDQYELIQRVLKDDKEISSKTARAINEKLEKIKELSGNRELGDIIRPGEVDYAAVQQGKIHETLDKKTDQLNQTADSQKQRADERSDKKREQAQQEAAPSLQKAGKAAAEAAFISGGWLSFEDEWENGMVAYCTFQQMSRCVYNIGNVRSCVFEKCREAIKECTSEISESRFEECEKAIVDVCAKAVVSNCQFIHCKSEKLLTTRGNSQVTIQDCEFSNIRWEEQEFRSYTWQSMIVIGLAEKNFANADRPSRINRCIFNGICIVPNEPGKVQKKENSAYLIAVNIENYAKFKYPRAEVTDCTFVNCAAEHAVINKEPYDSVFGSSHNYTAIRAYTRNNTGLDQIGNPATFAESQNVKRKETDAASRKIGDSLPVE